MLPWMMYPSPDVSKTRRIPGLSGASDWRPTDLWKSIVPAPPERRQRAISSHFTLSDGRFTDVDQICVSPLGNGGVCIYIYMFQHYLISTFLALSSIILDQYFPVEQSSLELWLTRRPQMESNRTHMIETKKRFSHKVQSQSLFNVCFQVNCRKTKHIHGYSYIYIVYLYIYI